MINLCLFFSGVIDAKYIQFIFIIIVATLFHKSAIILFVLIFFKFRFNKFYLIFILVGTLFISELFLDLINNSQYTIYLNILKYEQKANSLFLLIYISILIYIPWFLGYFSNKMILNAKETVLLNMNLMSLLILIVGYKLNIDFLSLMRVNMYFQIQLIILIPIMISKIHNLKIKNLLMYIIMVFILIYYFNTVYNNGTRYNLVPYKTVLDK